MEALRLEVSVDANGVVSVADITGCVSGACADLSKRDGEKVLVLLLGSFVSALRRERVSAAPVVAPVEL